MGAHPLDSLSAEEFTRTAEILTQEHGIDTSWRYASIILVEPPKAELREWNEGDPVVRRSLSVVWKKATNEVYEAVVNLTEGAVESWTHVPGVTPNFTLDEYHDCDHAMKAHPDVKAALAKRGIDDVDSVLFDVWTYGGAVLPEQYRDRRLGWVDLWLKKNPTGNPYAHPVSGLKLIVDMNTLELLEIEEHHDYGLPEVDAEYVPELRGITPRTDLKPLEIVQPEGVTFDVDGTRIKWLNWTFRLGFNYREGPVIYQVTFDDNGVERQVAHRLSFAEMIVPYRDSSFDNYRRTAFDIGEWGLGYMCTSLELGCDCLGEITYLDAVLPDTQGQPWEIKNAICLHEEDDGVLWKHVDADEGAEVRRMRRFVVSSHATVANYEYLIYWRFYPDGNIECEVRATGLMVTAPTENEGDKRTTGTIVDKRTFAPYHQHFLVAKIDLDVDGTRNTVVESDSVPAPISESNPLGLDLNTVSTVVESEAQAGRSYSWERQRSWKVTNPDKLNAWGAPVAYKLVPGDCFPAMFDEASPILKRNPVIGKQLWVTKHHEREMWPAGDYPTQAVDDLGNGMSAWIADDENLVGEDVVLWYVFGIHHITRPEDWPIMPVDKISFFLKPSGFFDRNPSLDAPRSAAHCAPKDGSTGGCGDGCCGGANDAADEVSGPEDAGDAPVGGHAGHAH